MMDNGDLPRIEYNPASNGDESANSSNGNGNYPASGDDSSAFEGVKKCGARLKGGRICRQPAMPSGKCKLHGGRSLGGIASPVFKHGRYSKYMPEELRRDYRKAIHDSDLTSLNDELALITTRVNYLLKKLGDTTTPPWGMVIDALENVLNCDTAEQFEVAIKEMEQLVRGGKDAADKSERYWGEIRELIQEKTRTASAEWKRLSDLNAVITVEQALMFASSVLYAAQEIFPDKKQLQAFQERVLALMPSDKE